MEFELGAGCLYSRSSVHGGQGAGVVQRATGRVRRVGAGVATMPGCSGARRVAWRRAAGARGGGRPWHGLCELGRRGTAMRCRGDHFPRPEGTVRCWGEARGGARARWGGYGAPTWRGSAAWRQCPCSRGWRRSPRRVGSNPREISVLSSPVGWSGVGSCKESKNNRLNPSI